MEFKLKLYRDGPPQAPNTAYYIELIMPGKNQPSTLHESLTFIGILTATNEEHVNAIMAVVYPYKGNQEVLIASLKERKITVTINERRILV